ncbi:MAG: MotA/TolQ/ExbB proton channel family protein [Candidatus Binatus sp.]|uniref:MotA/TolQ/ExbB proton channel family protein n=1 Tax=Candidatus Binatus sp. TaxID=2811406 RepID=UPI002715BA62|nr:MotA/TolQ/ExbB proton channel family protein [Candidatus Binatus sp.]MDO8433634.1 MotA/TolQ/ExbB proton channel family protein [Candidatus Binatus sp.]
MDELRNTFDALRYGGAMVYPLLVLGVIALVIIFDRAAMYLRSLRMPAALLELIETYGFSWDELDQQLKSLGPRNAYARFFRAIADNRSKPAWWVESRAGDEAGGIEKSLGRGLWVLETIVTAAPLMGLLGTITGMMQAFQVIGGSGLVAPTQVTAGVAQALIATALGLLIALFALFGFNFFSRTQSHALDQMERLGSRLIDHIRLDQESQGGAGIDDKLATSRVGRGAAGASR